MTHHLTDTRAEYHAGPLANDSSNLVTYKCPECGETWEMEEADGPRFCGVCAGDKGDDVRLMIKRKKSPVGPASEPEAPPDQIAINRTFADGSRLELRVSGGEALAFYYEWLWAALEREGD